MLCLLSGEKQVVCGLTMELGFYWKKQLLLLLHKLKAGTRASMHLRAKREELRWVLRLGNLLALFYTVNDQAQLQSLWDPETLQMPAVSHILLSHPLPSAQVWALCLLSDGVRHLGETLYRCKTTLHHRYEREASIYTGRGFISSLLIWSKIIEGKEPNIWKE